MMKHFNDLWKMVATLGVWAILGAIAIVAMAGTQTLHDPEAVVIGSMVMAIVATGMIWVAPEMVPSKKQDASQSQSFEKAKRGGNDKLALLLELMDEDERQAFKESLKRRYINDVGVDGELPYDFYDDAPSYMEDR